jgi:hypothetical protein
MPRHRRRFEKLHQTLKDTNYQATTGPAGEYLNYLKGVNHLTVPRKPSADVLKIFNVGVIPFGEEPDTTAGAINALQTTMTVEAQSILNAAGSIAPDAIFGIERDLKHKTRIENAFYAAKAIITVVATSVLSAPKTQSQSSITKRNYKRYLSRSGGVPYGRNTNTVGATTEGGAPVTPLLPDVTEEQVRKTIADALKGKVIGSYTVTALNFIPEEFDECREFDKAQPTTIPQIPNG